MLQRSNYRKGPCTRAWDGHDWRPFVQRTHSALAGDAVIGVVLVTQGRLASEFRAALEHAVAPQDQIDPVTTGPDDNVKQRPRNITEAVTKVDTGDGVVIL